MVTRVTLRRQLDLIRRHEGHEDAMGCNTGLRAGADSLAEGISLDHEKTTAVDRNVVQHRARKPIQHAEKCPQRHPGTSCDPDNTIEPALLAA